MYSYFSLFARDSLYDRILCRLQPGFFNLRYHMYGPDVNNLTVLTSVQGQISKTLFLMHGTHGDIWRLAEVEFQNPANQPTKVSMKEIKKNHLLMILYWSLIKCHCLC